MILSFLLTQNIHEICLKVVAVVEYEFISGELPVCGAFGDKPASL